MAWASASRTTGHRVSESRLRPVAAAAAPATATDRADDPPRPEPEGTFDCVVTFTPDSIPRARRMKATSSSSPAPRTSVTSFPSALRKVSLDSMRTPSNPVSTRHHARRSMAQFTVTAPGW